MLANEIRIGSKVEFALRCSNLGWVTIFDGEMAAIITGIVALPQSNIHPKEG